MEKSFEDLQRIRIEENPLYLEDCNSQPMCCDFYFKNLILQMMGPSQKKKTNFLCLWLEKESDKDPYGWEKN